MEMFNHSPLITVLTGNNLAHSSCVGSEIITTKYYFFRSQLLTKTHVLKPSKVRYLNTAFLAYLSEVELPLIGGNSDFVEQLNKISYLPSISEDSSQLEKINELSFFDSFNCVDKVAVTSNNARQERQNLLNPVQYHHTLVDVFLCLSFANCLFAGELRLALALVRLWWGGSGNKPLGANTTCRLCFAVLNLPTALSLGQSSKSLPIRKV